MADINLLPDDLRKKEEAERKAAPKPAPTPFTWREPTLVKPTFTPSAKSPSTPPLPKGEAKGDFPMPTIPQKSTSPSLREPVKPVSVPPPPVPKPGGLKSPPSVQKIEIPSVPWWSALVMRFASLFRRIPRPSAPPEQPKQEVSAALDVNLMATDVSGRRAALTPITRIVTTALIAVGGALLIVIGVWILVKINADNRARQSAVLDAQIASAKRDVAERTKAMQEIQDFGDRLKVVKKLLDAHPLVGPLFTFLERETATRVQVTDVLIRLENRQALLNIIALDVPSLVGQLMHWAEQTPVIEKLEVNAVVRQNRAEFVLPVYAVSATLTLTQSFVQPWNTQDVTGK